MKYLVGILTFLAIVMPLSAQNVYVPFVRLQQRGTWLPPQVPGIIWLSVNGVKIQTSSAGNAYIVTSATPGGGGAIPDPLVLNAFQGDSFTDKVGTGAAPFPQGATVGGVEVLSKRASEISTLPAKATPVGADLAVIEDSADSNNKKQATITSVTGVPFLQTDSVPYSGTSTPEGTIWNTDATPPTVDGALMGSGGAAIGDRTYCFRDAKWRVTARLSDANDWIALQNFLANINLGSVLSTVSNIIRVYGGDQDNEPGLIAIYPDGQTVTYPTWFFMDSIGNLRAFGNATPPTDDDTQGNVFAFSTASQTWPLPQYSRSAPESIRLPLRRPR